MNRETFETFQSLVYAKSGIALGDRKESLVSARVGKRMRELGIETAEAYLEHLTADNTGEEIVHLLDVISTNVTHFFREAQHFTFLEDRLREWIAQGQRKFRFWSAGCSSGEEPYTLAMTVLEVFETFSANFDMRILATDLSTRILSKAGAGEYDISKMEGIPPKLVSKYFTQSHAPGAKSFRASTRMKGHILFRRLNLSIVPFPMQGPMDIIFCRNVMIYFDNEVRKRLLEEFYRLLKSGGYLMVGHAESLTGMLSGFKVVKPAIYRKD